MDFNVRTYLQGRYRVIGWTVGLLLIIYLLSLIFLRVEALAVVWDVLRLEPALVVGEWRFWTLVSYGLLHDPQSPFHLLFNGLILFFLAPPLIDRWGERRYALFMWLCVLGGGLLVWAMAAIGFGGGSVIGFSGAALGTVVGWCLTYPTRQIYMFGVFPMTGKVLLWGTIGLECLFALSLSNVSTAAHFGGMGMAAFLVHGLYSQTRLRWWWHQLLVIIKVKKKPNLKVVPTYDKGADKFIH